jgi:hypothetical protein
MIKRIFILTLLVFSFHLSPSQVLISLIFGDKLNSDKIEFGLELGANYSKMSNFESSHPLPSFFLGFYFDFLLKNQWYINTGVLVKSEVGLDFLKVEDVAFLDPTTVYIDSGTYSQKIKYFHVPILIKYKFKNHFYAQLGPQVALRTKASLRYFGEFNNRSTEFNTDNRDMFHRLEVSAIAGVGYKLKKGEGMNIGIKYMFGLTDVIRDESRSSKNSSYYLCFDIPIGKGKAEKKKAESE